MTCTDAAALPTGRRCDLSACLVAAGRERVLDAAARWTQGLTVTPLLLPEAGLALMQWRDAVYHQRFFLGEVPMARAAVALIDERGRRIEGAAVVMADDAELARALAVLDALFVHRWPGAEAIEALVRLGAQARERVRAVRQACLKRTQVDFALLAGAEPHAEGEA